MQITDQSTCSVKIDLDLHSAQLQPKRHQTLAIEDLIYSLTGRVHDPVQFFVFM